MSKKTIIILTIVLLIAAGVLAGVFVFRSSPGGPSPSVSPKPSNSVHAPSDAQTSDAEAKMKILEENADYYKKNGNTKIPPDYVVNGVWLSRWLYEQIARLNGKSSKKLDPEQINKLAKVKVFPK